MTSRSLSDPGLPFRAGFVLGRMSLAIRYFKLTVGLVVAYLFYLC
jgi:hypothetical protein